MSRHHTGHFYEIFDNLLKANIIMQAYIVAPYGIRLEGTRKNALNFFLKDYHHDILETRKIHCFTSIHAQKLTNLSSIWVLH